MHSDMNETLASSSLHGGVEEGEREYGCLAEEVADTRLYSRQEVIAMVESLTVGFLQAISRGEDPELSLVSTTAT